MTRSLRERTIRRWSRSLIAALGVKVKIEGEVVQNGPVMLVANHVSWIDIFLINSCRATSFVAKQEIESWPLSRLVRQAGQFCGPLQSLSDAEALILP